jgi:hypothetical protein
MSHAIIGKKIIMISKKASIRVFMREMLVEIHENEYRLIKDNGNGTMSIPIYRD